MLILILYSNWDRVITIWWIFFGTPCIFVSDWRKVNPFTKTVRYGRTSYVASVGTCNVCFFYKISPSLRPPLHTGGFRRACLCWREEWAFCCHRFSIRFNKKPFLKELWAVVAERWENAEGWTTRSTMWEWEASLGGSWTTLGMALGRTHTLLLS